jgi:peptidyl-prolyl cis-trans isomerase D
MVVGPFDTELGPALFRNNAILAVRETSFEQAMPALREQLAADRARRVIDDASSDIDDLLVGGATLDEIANETDMQLGTINWFEGSGETIAAYNAFQLAARTATTTDFPEIIRTDDGGIFALRVDEIIAPAVAPIADVMPKVIAGWETQATEDALTAQAEVLAASLGEGRSASSLGLNPTAENTIRREGFVAGLPPETVTVIYDMQPGDTEIVNGFGAVLIVQLDSINPSTQDDPERAARIELLSEQAQQGIAQDLLDIYARAIQLEAGVSLNYSALNAVHTQFQGGGGYGN